MAKVRAVIIGSGLIACKKHVPAFQRLRGKAELAAICDLNAEAAARVAKQFGIPKVYGDVQEMLRTERPDLVDLCTPPQTHARLAVEAAKAGSNVLVEKPMAMTAEDCDRIVNAARDYKVKICVAHSDLFYEPFMRARELVRQGAIGTFRGMRILLSTPTGYMTSKPDHWAHKLPGGVIGESGPHVVYMTLAFLTGISHVHVEAVKLLPQYPWSRFEDYRIEMVGKEGISSIMLTYATNQWMAKVELLGEKGALHLDLENMTLERYSRTQLKAAPVAVALGGEALARVRSLARNTFRYATKQTRSTHELILDSFLSAIQSNTEPPVTAEEGREAVRVLGLITSQLEQRVAVEATA